MNDTLPKSDVKSLEEPAKRWRNRYWFARTIVLRDCPQHPGGPFGPGVFVPRASWPSQDIAETLALMCIERHPIGEYVTYLGAEPTPE